MEVPKETKELMTRYLLGQVSPVEQEALENRYAAEPEAFEQLVAIENELADRYARGELSAEDQSAFERHVLAHPRRRARADFAAALLAQCDYAREPEKSNAKITAEPTSWWKTFTHWRFAFAIVSTACLLMWSGWWLWRKWQAPPTSSLTAQRVTDMTPTPTSTLEAHTPSIPASPAPSVKAVPATVALTLNANLLRGTELQTVPWLVIQADAQMARLTLKAEASGYGRYRLLLQNSRSQTVRSAMVVAAKGDFLLEVPARFLANGEHALVLQGVNPNGEADTLSKTAFGVRRTQAAR